MNLSQNMNLSQKLQHLPEELHRIILDKYKRMFLFKEITENNSKKLDKLQSSLCDLQIPETEYNTFVDVGDFTHFTRLLSTTDFGKRPEDNVFTFDKMKAFRFLIRCITGVLEYYYSLTYYERIKLDKTILVGNDGNDDSDGNDDNDDNHDNDDNDDNDNYDNRETAFLNHKILSELLNPEDCHSYSTGTWCYRIVIKFMYGTNDEKLDLWIKLINSHFLIR
jgi:hypothetical protein